MFWTLDLCIRSIASAGHMVVCVVTVQMVGARRSAGATILGVEVVYFLRQPSGFSPRRQVQNISDAFLCVGQCTRWQVVYILLGSFSRVCSGTSVHSARGVAASSPRAVAEAVFSFPVVAGDFGFVSRHKLAEHRIPDVSATPGR